MSDLRQPSDPSPGRGNLVEVFRVTLLLGLTSFGGPIAHIGYFHREYVVRRRWLSEAGFVDLVALCQFLPGPASSQLGIAIGLLRAGYGGALAAWLGFTLPSAVMLTVLALVTGELDLANAGWVHGLKLAAVAVVAAAVVSMWRSLAPDWPRRGMAVLAAGLMLFAQTAALQVALIAAGGIAGWWLFAHLAGSDAEHAPFLVSRRIGVMLLTVFAALLIGLPLLGLVTQADWVAVVESFFRAGALVFGGGHVVLPLLSESVVAPGWVDESTFLAGYGAAQAVPGPLFTFAAYLGASLETGVSGIPGAAIALGAIFLPSFLLVIGVLPFWERLRRSARFRGALAGTNAAVIGLLLAALYDPVWTSAIMSPLDVVLAVLAFVALVAVGVAPWIVVGGLAVVGQLMQLLG